MPLLFIDVRLLAALEALARYSLLPPLLPLTLRRPIPLHHLCQPPSLYNFTRHLTVTPQTLRQVSCTDGWGS